MNSKIPVPDFDANGGAICGTLPIAIDTVVTRTRDRAALSLFRDDIWDFVAFADNASSMRVHFRNFVASGTTPVVVEASRADLKRAIYLLAHHTEEQPALLTLLGHVSALRSLSRFASTRHQTLHEALEDADTVALYLHENPHASATRKLHSALVGLHQIGADRTGIAIPLAKLHFPLMRNYRGVPDAAQHPVIPTRIYSHFLNHCEKELAVAEAAADDVVRLMHEFYASGQMSTKLPPNLQALMLQFGRTVKPNYFSALVAEIGVLCQAVIISFTGMRAKEAENLPFDCLKVFQQDGVTHYAIEGVTTKLSGGRPKRACWVTNHAGARAVNLAKKVFCAAHEQLGWPEYKSSSDGEYRLFCRVAIHPEGRYERRRSLTPQYVYWHALRNRACPRIDLADVAELKTVDPFRAWEAEAGFSLGAIWPFTRHQLRRSLALYAQRSGLVTLPSLKRQLHHITDEMSLYYARGSAFAKNVLATSADHFAMEWVASQGLSQYLSYAAQVLQSDEHLSGGHAAWAKSSRVKQSPVSVYSREQAIQMFERGEFAYRETVLGGCTSTEPCDASPLQWLHLECLESDCRNLVVQPARLRRVVAAQQRHVETLRSIRPDSVEYRMEAATLTTLRAAVEKYCAREKRE